MLDTSSLIRVLSLVLLAAMMVTGTAPAQEASIIAGSTLIGVNAGVPTGCPGQGFPEVGHLDLALETAVIFKNLELFSLPGILGETHFLYLEAPRLRYRAADNLTVEVGALLGHNLGDDTPLDIHRPLLRLIHTAMPGVYVIAGTLFPTHWIHDGILDDVQKLRTEVEEGFQLRVDRVHYQEDTWLNWRVREGVVRAEEFEIASCQRLRVWGGRLQGEGQFMWSHAGGQISSSGRVEQDLMYLAGASLGSRGTAGLRVGYNHLYSRNDSDRKPMTTGGGQEVWGFMELGLGPAVAARLAGSRFWGDGLESGRGDPLYGLDDYSQLGINLLLKPRGTGLGIEAGFVKQWTDEVRNLTYQLTMTWGRAFSLGRPRLQAP